MVSIETGGAAVFSFFFWSLFFHSSSYGTWIFEEYQLKGGERGEEEERDLHFEWKGNVVLHPLEQKKRHEDG